MQATQAGDEPRNHTEPVTAPASTHIVDPDVDLHDASQRAETRPRRWDLLAAVAVGGVIGAEARHGIGAALPAHGGAFPWATLLINATGCLLIGALMVAVLELSSPHRLLRPFLGTGLLGGYTTFSTFAVETERLVRDQRPLAALGYVILTVLACLLAVYLATIATRAIGRAMHGRGSRRARQRTAGGQRTADRQGASR